MSAELVGIELQLKGYEGVMADMRALDAMLNGFRGRSNRIEIQSNLAQAKKELLALKGAMTEFQSEQAKVSKGGTAWHILQGYIEETNAKMKDCRQRINEIVYALRNLQGMSFGQVFNKISSTVAHLGSAMQSAGNALTRLTSPFQRFTSGMIMGAGYKALNKFTEGFESAFTRSDTMRKYTRLMAEYSTDNYSAEKSVQDLDKSVQGLPIALDDAVSLAQRYTLSLGNMERGTKLAIATNNAFLASMSSETQRYQGMMQMQDLLNGKDLNSREWMSLGASMGKAINEIGKEFGYTNENMGEFRQELYAGNIATEDFLDALEKVGTGNGSLVTLAQQSMDTWEAFFSRVGTAASRFGYGIIKSLDEIVTTVTGGKFESVNSLLDDQFIPAIDRMSASVQKWIKAHPEEIADFFKSLKSINWGSIVKGFGEGLLQVADTIKGIADLFGGRDLSWIGKWMVKGNILGNFLTIFGGLLKGSRGIIASIGASLFKGGQGIRNIIKAGGIANWLKGVALGEGDEGTRAMETVAKASPKMGKFSLGLSKIFKGWAEIATMVGGSAFVAWGSMKLLKGSVKSFKEMVDILNDVDWDMGKKALLGIGGFFGAMAGLSAIAGRFVGAGVGVLFGEAIVGAFTTFASGVAALDMHLLKSAFKSFADLTKYLNEGIENLNNIESVDNVGGVKTKVQNAITTFNQIIDMFQEPVIDSGRNNPVTGDAKQSKLKKLSGDVTKTVEGLKTSLQSMLDAVKSLNEISQIRVNTGGLGAVIPGIKVGLAKIGNMLEDLPEGLGSDGTAKNVANMSSAMANLKTAFSAMIGSDGILALLPQIASRIQRLQHGGQIEQLNQQMDVLGRGLKELMNSLDFGGFDTGGLMSDMTNLKSSLDQVQAIIEQINGLGKVEVDTAGTENIKTVISNIKSAFDEAQGAELSGEIIAMVASVKAALAMFEDLNTDIEINPKVKVGSGFKSSVRTATGQIRSANGDIQNAVNSIQTNYFKRVNIRIAVNTIISRMGDVGGTLDTIARNVANSVGGSIGGRFSRNGVLYRSSGGSIFKPRGVDKIPAMLAEGEYVHKKQAVDYFGTDFMRAVNNMDVRGAMNALLHKAGNATSVGRQSIVNNTVNNNQRITQNISTNNPNFARARMGRFVGAL